ncbi:hypothetical protein [Lacrimispora sp.]|uniref:hypothetical protein n=1 Tax=Lacrimispora sp. TaxID=2719234 RepID=UPI0032E3C60C
MIEKLRTNFKCYTDILYLLYFLPIAGCVSMGISSNQLIYKVCFTISIIFLLLKVWVTDYKTIEILFMGVIMFLLGYIYLRTSEKSLIISALSIFGCKDVNVKKVLKYTLFVYIIGMILTINMILLGKIQGGIHTLNKGGIEYKINDFGFSHPNSAYFHLFMITLMIVAVWQERLHWYHYAIMTVIMFVAYKVFLSRTGLLIYLLLCMAISILHIIKFDKLKKALFFTLNLIPVGVFTLSYILMIYYDKNVPLINKLNNFVTGRIMCSSQALKYSGISWFGTVNRLWMEWIFIDNAYLSILISYGIVVCIFCVTAYTLTCFRYWRAGEYYILIILNIIAVYAFMEYMVVSATWNPMLLFMSGVLLWSGREEDKAVINLNKVLK